MPAAQAELLETMGTVDGSRTERTVRRIPRSTQLVQTAVSLVLLTVKGLQWLVGLATLTELLRLADLADWSHPVSWWVLGAGWILFITPFGRMGLSAAAARAQSSSLGPGTQYTAPPGRSRVPPRASTTLTSAADSWAAGMRAACRR